MTIETAAAFDSFYSEYDKYGFEDLNDFLIEGKNNSPLTNYKPSSFMSIVNKRYLQDLPDVNITSGYITFIKRNKLGLLKTHHNDAFVIANGDYQIRCNPTIITQKHRNNRILQRNRKGYKPSIRRQRYKIQPKDLVWIDGYHYVSIGIQNNGTHIKLKNIKRILPIIQIQKIYHFGGLIFS